MTGSLERHIVLVILSWGGHGGPRDVSVPHTTAAAAAGPQVILAFFESVSVVPPHFHRIEVDSLCDQTLVSTTPDDECSNQDDQNKSDKSNDRKYDS